MRAWAEQYGREPSSYDWSRTHARRRGGQALERLEQGESPAAATVSGLYSSWAARADGRPLRLRMRLTSIGRAISSSTAGEERAGDDERPARARQIRRGRRAGRRRSRDPPPIACAANGRYAWTFDRGRDFARGVWVVDPLFMLDVIRERVAADDGDAPAREESYFAGARLRDPDVRAAVAEDRERRAAARQRRAEATASNLGLGHDIRAGLTQLSDEQLDAARTIVCHLIAGQFRDIVAYGAGWTDRERQQSVGDS